MNVHAIYLPSTEIKDTWGSPVLLESNGRYLLMDATQKGSQNDIISYLKKNNISELDLFVSHYHVYAYESHAGILTDPYFQVGTMYLPDNSIGAEIPYDDISNQTIRKYAKQIAVQHDAKIKYLNVGDSFTVGDATVKVIGPVGNYSYADIYASKLSYNEATLVYANSTSLVTMITCGNKKFLSAGDMSAPEENALMKKYSKSFLKADIYQLPHHGLNSSDPAFIEFVRPNYSFSSNHKFTIRYPKTHGSYGHRQTFRQRERASWYGLYYMTGDEKKDLVIKVNNNNIFYYKNGKKLTGWVTVQGGDWIYRPTDKYYISPTTGKPYTGIRKVDGKYYNFSTGGCVVYAAYDKNGKYKYWKGSENEVRYYTKSAEMYIGFRKVGKKLYYFNKSGYKKLGNSKYKPVIIASKKYLIDKNGVIYTKGWKKYSNGKKRYVTKKGVMVTGWKKIGKTKYYFSKKTGYMTKQK